jgi:hypothetical protein
MEPCCRLWQAMKLQQLWPYSATGTMAYYRLLQYYNVFLSLLMSIYEYLAADEDNRNARTTLDSLELMQLQSDLTLVSPIYSIPSPEIESVWQVRAEQATGVN